MLVSDPKWAKRCLHVHQLGTHVLFATILCEWTGQSGLRNGCLETIPMLLFALCCSTVRCRFTEEQEQKKKRLAVLKPLACTPYTSRGAFRSCISSHCAFLRGPINTTTVPFIPDISCVCTVCLLTLAPYSLCASLLRDVATRWMCFMPIKAHFLPRSRWDCVLGSDYDEMSRSALLCVRRSLVSNFFFSVAWNCQAC